ncbi:MAG: zinc ribbon domain-containing protein [Promethearchaeota archaeon]
MPRYCVYCGNKIRENDKFCISCGKPLLSNLPKSSGKSSEKVFEQLKEIQPKKDKKEKKKKKSKEIEEDKVVEDKDQSEIEEETEVIEEEEKEEEKKKKKEKEKKREKEIKPLPEDIKEQIEIYLEFTEIRLKKKTLVDKLNDLEKSMKSPEYDTDFVYGEKISIQLKALKTLIEEFKEKENAIKQKISTPFIVEKLNIGILTKRDQLKNLTRQHRLKKVKDKNVFEQLRERYKREMNELKTERDDLIAGIKLWIGELEMEETELITEQKFNKARFSAKEISEEEFKEKDSELEKKLIKLRSKIKTMETLAKKK